VTDLAVDLCLLDLHLHRHRLSIRKLVGRCRRRRQGEAQSAAQLVVSARDLDGALPPAHFDLGAEFFLAATRHEHCYRHDPRKTSHPSSSEAVNVRAAPAFHKQVRCQGEPAGVEICDSF
jgi:hypothetical protein